MEILNETDHDPIRCPHCGYLAPEIDDLHDHYERVHYPALDAE